MKIYKVIIEKHDAYEGKRFYTCEEYVKTTNIEAYIEAKMTEIEKNPEWWLEYHKAYTGINKGRPVVVAKEIEVKEV